MWERVTIYGKRVEKKMKKESIPDITPSSRLDVPTNQLGRECRRLSEPEEWAEMGNRMGNTTRGSRVFLVEIGNSFLCVVAKVCFGLPGFVRISNPFDQELEFVTMDTRVADLFNFVFLFVIDQDRRRRGFSDLGREGRIDGRFEKDFIEHRVDLFPRVRYLKTIRTSANLVQDLEGSKPFIFHFG